MREPLTKPGPLDDAAIGGEDERQREVMILDWRSGGLQCPPCRIGTCQCNTTPLSTKMADWPCQARSPRNIPCLEPCPKRSILRHTEPAPLTHRM